MNTLSVAARSRISRWSVPALVLAGGLASAVLLAGCDSLDVEDPNAPGAEDVTAQSLVIGTEGAMRIDLEDYLQVVGILGREIYFFEPADPRFTGELYLGPLDPNGFLLTRPWNARYRTIKNANDLLARAEDFDAEEQAGIEGFAKTVIGYQLLLVLNYLDENGIKIVFNDDVNTPFVSKEEAFAEIERYLDEAHTALTSDGAAFNFSLSPGFEGFNTPATFDAFNRALRARVALYQDKHQEALDLLEESFIDREADLDLGVYHVFSSGSGDRINMLFEVPTASTVKLRAHPSFEADAEAGDLRAEQKVLDRTGDPSLNASPPEANGLSSKVVVTVYDGATAPIPVIRNEELLLIRAEALIGLGQYDQAEPDINRVRAAAGLDAVDLNAGNAVDQLLYERRYSLFMEGHRWVDLRRFGRLDTLPKDTVGDPPQEGRIFSQMPRPQDELPEG